MPAQFSLNLLALAPESRRSAGVVTVVLICLSWQCHQYMEAARNCFHHVLHCQYTDPGPSLPVAKTQARGASAQLLRYMDRFHRC